MTSAGDDVTTAVDAAVTAFVCSNCARGGTVPSSSPPQPATPSFDWPFDVEEVLVPCSGTVQPEHLLKAVEAGADLVCVIACEEDNCHRLEGSRRAARRVEYVGALLDQAGLGAARVMLLHLPGSSRQDMAVGAGQAAPAGDAAPAEKLRSLREEVIARLRSLPPNPLRQCQTTIGSA